MTDDSLRLAVCSWSLAPAGVEDLVEALHRLEIRSVQLALVPLVESPERWRDAIERLRAASVEVVSGMLATVGEDYSTLESIARTGGVRPDGTWPATRARAESVARIAGDAGIGLVTFHAGFIPHDPADPLRERLLERLRVVVDLFARHGVRVAFETGQESAETLAGALEALDRPEAGINFDPANMILYGMGDPLAALRRLRPWVRQVHVKDALPSRVPGAWGTEVVVGQGAVPWREFLAEVRRIEPPVRCVIEREAGATREADIRAAAAVIRGA